jgi:sec-independent protein translocase protein TatA
MSPILLGFLGNIGTTELLVVGGIILLLFGHRLPSLMRSLGRGVTEFKQGLNSPANESEEEEEEVKGSK